MEIALVTVTICRHTGKELGREVRESFEVDEDEYYRPLVEVLGNEFIKYREGKELNNGRSN